MNSSTFQLRKNVVSAIVGFAANACLVFISYRLVILQEGISALGLWSTLMAWIYMIRLGDVGMASATTRFIALADIENEAEKIRTYIDTGILFNAVLFLLLSIAGLIVFQTQIALIVPISAKSDALKIIPIMFIGFFLTNLSGLISGALQGLHQGYIASWLGICCTFLQLAVVAILVPSLGLGGLAWGIVVQHTVLILLGWIFIYRKIKVGSCFPSHLSKPAIKEMLGYSMKVQITSLANGFFEPLSKIIVSRFGNLEMQGIYELAYKTVLLPRNAVISGAQATLPATANLIRNDLAKANELYRKVLRMVLKAVSAVLLVVILVAPLISLLWTGKYNQTYWMYVACLALGFLGNAIGAPAYNLGLAAGQMNNNFVSAILVLLIMAGLGTIAGLSFGVIGVVLTAMIALAFGGIFIKWRNETLLFGL